MNLGSNQKGVLTALVESGKWNAFFGRWVWDTPSNTARILESLCRKGLAKRAGRVKLNGYPAYLPTEKGINLIKARGNDAK